MALPALLLAAALAGYWWVLHGALPMHPALDRWLGAPPRRRGYRRWLLKSLLAFGLLPVGCLLVLGRLDAVLRVPPEFSGSAKPVAGLLDGPPLVLGATVAGGVLLGTAIRIALLRWRRREWVLGDIASIRPQARGERRYALLLSVTAGVTEELFFRLLLPLLVALIAGVGWPGFVLSVMLFAYAHRYQGWAGVVATGVVGAIATLVYLASGSLVLVMVAHTLLDINGLLVAPALARRFGRAD